MYRHELYAAYLQTIGLRLEVSTTYHPQQCVVKLHSVSHPSRCLHLHTQQHPITAQQLLELLQEFTALSRESEETAILNDCLNCLYRDDHEWHYKEPFKTVGTDAIIQSLTQ